jgi:uncharacterized coiled-coil protein SlyX
MFNFRAEKRLTELEERIAKVERASKDLEAEWSNAWDKLRRMMQRVAKRAEVAERGADPDAEHQLPLASGNEPTHGRMLNERQRQLQQEILRRRAGG